MPAPASPNTQIRIASKFMFSDHKNNHKPRLEKRQRKLLKKLPHLAAFLEPDETVLLVSPCVSPTPFFEQLTTGWIFVYINRALLVVTNKAILHIPTKSDFSYRNSIARIRYADCKQLRIRGRHLFVQYGSGKKEWYLYLPRSPRLKLKAYCRTLKLDADVSRGAKRHLCPRCTRPLTPAVYQCPSCRLPFKNLATAIRLSLLLPGGGYFYTRHPLLGISDFVVELFLLVVVINSIMDIANGRPQGGVLAVFFGMALVLEKLLTIYHAKRYILDFLPKETKIQPRPTAVGVQGAPA